jgi:integrase
LKVCERYSRFNDEGYEVLYVLAIRTGLRRGELLGLRWSDVDLEEAGKLRVIRQLQRRRDGGGRVFFSPPKSGKGRVIRLTPPAIDALKRHRVRQAEEKLKAGGLYEDQGLVFATEKGTPLDPPNINRRSFKPLLERAGLPNIRFHDLRHAAALPWGASQGGAGDTRARGYQPHP